MLLGLAAHSQDVAVMLKETKMAVAQTIHRVKKLIIHRNHQVNSNSNYLTLTIEERDGEETIKHKIDIYAIDTAEIPIEICNGQCY